MKLYLTLLAALLVFGCSKPAQPLAPQEYTLIRPETSITNNDGTVLMNDALYQKTGDSDHVYMKSLRGNWIAMPK
jgi:hypothetical protein